MTKNEPEDRSSGDTTTTPRKPYEAPRLTVYGDLHRIAQVKGGVRGDGGGKPVTKL